LNGDSLFWFSDANNDGTGAIMRMRLDTGTVTTLVGANMRGSGSPRWVGATNPPVISVNDHFAAYVDDSTLGSWVNGKVVPLGKVGRDVYVVSLAGGKPRLVTRNQGDQAYPAIAGSARQVLWLDGVQGRVDIMTRRTPAG
jgi:hypothetical protein